ncbi:hypothetical protein FXO37_11913 [Capsicum annuum]|nr:hypothetical protein FXO37_11913 [Capsicum annuum]
MISGDIDDDFRERHIDNTVSVPVVVGRDFLRPTVLLEWRSYHQEEKMDVAHNPCMHLVDNLEGEEPQVKFINPVLRSPIVGDVAYETLVKLSKCTATPLCNWALEIATALRLIMSADANVLWGQIPCAGEEVSNGRPGLFECVTNGLSISCKTGSLPVDSFTFVFPVLYHVLGVVPAYQATIGPALNELCLGVKSDEVAPALCGIYAKDSHVRMACLNAVKCIPALASHSVPQSSEIATRIWLALHDPEKCVSEAAEDIWDHYGYDLGTDYSGIFKALSHVNYNVRVAGAEALAAALDESPDAIQECLSTLFSLYIRDVGSGEDSIDFGWIGRQGIALALLSVAEVLRAKDLPVVMTFLISRALADPNADVRGRMINAGIVIIDKHGRENVSLLFPIFENYLNKKASDEEKYDLVREGVVIFTGALAKHLAKDDPKVHTVVEKLLDVLNTPSEAVQRAVATCLSPLMQAKQEDAPSLVSRLLDQLMKSDKYGERRGAAFGLAGLVKGFGISCLKKYGIVAALHEGFADRNSAKSREGALLAFECFCEKLGKLFEPYVIQMFPFLLVSFSDQVVAVRDAAECAARAMMSQLSAQGVKLILPSLLKGLEDKAWRTKQSSVQLLGAMAYCAPQQLSQCLPKIVPKLTEVLTDTHPKVQSAGQTALQQVGSVIKNPEISALVPTLLMGLTDPNEHTKYSLDILLQTTFVNSIDAPSLALLVPIVHRGLRERSAETKKKAAQIAGNMCSLVTEPKDMIPYIGLLLPEVKKVLVDPIPEVRSVAARAIGSLIRGMGEENFPDLVPWLLDTLKSDGSNVERSGAAQGLSEDQETLINKLEKTVPFGASSRSIGAGGRWVGLELVIKNGDSPFELRRVLVFNFNLQVYFPPSQVLAALGVEYFENILPDIIRNCSHQKASVRDGHLALFRYLPRSLGVQFQNYLQQVLPAILDGLADENESVREAALSAGHVLVEHYATTSLPLLLPAVEEGIFNDNWRIRQSSVELLGDLLFKVAGTSGKAHLEGGSDDEGASTEAQGRAIIEVLGRDKRNEILAALYMVRTDVSITVRQAALHVWKTIVANTPKTLKEIMPVLMSTLISSLASSSSERRQVAGRALGELVRKLGERVLPLIIPILSRGLKDSNPSRRQGVCIGLSEVMASAGRSQLLIYMDELIPTIRTALCDRCGILLSFAYVGVPHRIAEVRESAGLAFSTLYKNAGMQAIDEIVPTLLHALEDEETSDTALDGLKQILSVRTTAVLPHILPKLVHFPLSYVYMLSSPNRFSVPCGSAILTKMSLHTYSAFNAHALGALAEVAGPGLDSHLSTILPALLNAMGYADMASIRRSSAYLIGYLFKNSDLHLGDEAPNMLSSLIILLSDWDFDTVLVAWQALSNVVSSVPKEVLPTYIKLVRDAVSTSRDKERRKKKGGAVLIPGFCLPKALQPLLPVFLQGYRSLINAKILQIAESSSKNQHMSTSIHLEDISEDHPLYELHSYMFAKQTNSFASIVQEDRPNYEKLDTREQIVFIENAQEDPWRLLQKYLITNLFTLQGLISGSAELRQQAALGLGELIEVTSEKTLKEFVIPITGPLIRIIGDRFPWEVKSAILSTLSIIIRRGGIALKPFLPQLQTTFVKCLQDNTRTIRSSAAIALGKLSALSTRVDPLVGDLLSGVQTSDAGIREATLTALKGVIKHAGESVSIASRTRVYILLKDLIHNDDDQIRNSAASILGIVSQGQGGHGFKPWKQPLVEMQGKAAYNTPLWWGPSPDPALSGNYSAPGCPSLGKYLGDGQVVEVLDGLSKSTSSSNWCSRHGAVLTICSMLKHNPDIICASSSFPLIVNCLKITLNDEKFPVRETSTRALGLLLRQQIQSDPSNATSHVETLGSIVLAMQDDSSEVRRRGLSAVKAVSKVRSSEIANPGAIAIHVSKFGPVLADCLKDGNTSVRLAAERCALHAFQLAKGTENVQAAQKFITGLDARRIAKLPEHSDESGDSDKDASSSNSGFLRKGNFLPSWDIVVALNITVKAAAALNHPQFVSSFEISTSSTAVGSCLLSSSLPSAAAVECGHCHHVNDNDLTRSIFMVISCVLK